MTRKFWFEAFLILWICALPLSLVAGYVAGQIPEPALPPLTLYAPAPDASMQQTPPLKTALNFANIAFLLWVPVGWVPVVIARKRMKRGA